jgi:Xaa-Pro aminopeptidase
MADGLERCLGAMAEQDVDVLLLGRESNARFVSGAARLWLAGTRPFAPSCVVVRDTMAVHLLSITDAGVPPSVPPDHLYPLSWNPMTIITAVAGIDGVRAARRIGVDGLTPMWEQLIGATLPDAELVDGESLMRSARRIKSGTDLTEIRAAIDVASAAFQASVDAVRPGITERELVGVFEQRMAEGGTSTPAFEGTFCVVDDGRPLRRLSTDRVIADGDLLAMSAGVLLDGWEGSFARPWPCGEPTASQRSRWQRWDAARGALLDACRAGARVRTLLAVDGAAVHGSGLGYEGLSGDDVLEPGMVVSIALVRDGVLGQDLVHVTPGDPEILTTFVYPTFSA